MTDAEKMVRELRDENVKLCELLKDMWASMADCHDILRHVQALRGRI